MPVLVDGAQSVGAIPVDVGALDYYTVSGQKWLCGPDTTGALYIADVESLARRASRLLRAGVVRARRPVRAARGSAAVRPRLALDRVARRDSRPRSALAPEWRFERIREMAARCREALAGRAQVVTPPDQAGLVTFGVEEDAEAVATRLLEQGVVVRNIPGTPWRARVVRLVDERGRRRASSPRSLSSRQRPKRSHARGTVPRTWHKRSCRRDTPLDNRHRERSCRQGAGQT